MFYFSYFYFMCSFAFFDFFYFYFYFLFEKRKYINNEKTKTKKDSLIYAASSLQCFFCNVTISSASLCNQNYLFLTRILLPCSLLRLTSLTLNKIVLSLCTCYPLTESTLHHIEIRIRSEFEIWLCSPVFLLLGEPYWKNMASHLGLGL